MEIEGEREDTRPCTFICQSRLSMSKRGKYDRKLKEGTLRREVEHL